MKKILFIIISLISLYGLEFNIGEKDFSLRYQTNIYGNVKVIGNTVLCPKENGRCEDYSGSLTNTDLDLKYVDIDNNASTYDSSKAYLDIPDDAEIVYAGFYAQGYVDNDTDTTSVKNKLNKYIYLTINSLNRTIKFLPDEINILENQNDGYTYTLYTSLNNELNGLKGSDVKGWITAANIYANEGEEDSGLGNFGAWTLVVVYKDLNEHFKNITIFDGYKRVTQDSDVDIHVSGFITPLYGDVESTLSIFAGEGDKNIRGDKLEFDDTDISHKDNGKDNAFYSIITGVDNREPNLTNNNGIDIQNYNIGSSGLNLLSNGQTSADITLSSDGDWYFPNLVVFATDIYVPKVCYDNLKYFDENGNEITSGSQVSIGSKIRVELDVKNMENETAKNVFVRHIFDNNITSYVSNSTKIKNVLSDEFIEIDDNSSIGNLGVYYTENNKTWEVGIIGDSNDEFKPTTSNPDYIGTIDFNVTIENEGNITFDFLTSYIYTIGSDEYTYNDILPPCEEINSTLSAYSHITGDFNVVNMNYVDQSTIPNDDTGVNALYTQITNKNFHLRTVKVKDDNVTVEKYNGIIKVSLIQANNFDNLDSSQKLDLVNNESELATRYVEMGDSGSAPNYGEFNLTYSKVLREGTFKIVYLVHSDGSLVESKNNCLSAVPDYNCIWGMLTQVYTDSGYQNNANGNNVCPTGQIDTTACTCGDVCSYGTNGQGNGGANGDDHANEQCLECVFGQLPTNASLARDSFSIRPYAFRVFGNNQYKRAGEEFNLTIKAVDEANNAISTGNVNSVNGVEDYNISVNDLNFSSVFYTPTPAELAQMQSDMGESNVSYCPSAGVFSVVNPVNFVDGEVNATVKFSETGILTLNVSEINGSEFAKCDEDDTNDSQRLIQPASVIYDVSDINKTDVLLFIPYEFNTTAEYNTTTGANWVYVSNDVNYSNDTNTTPQMAAYVKYNIIALNKDGQITQNFTKTCFPDFTVNCPSVNGLKLNSTFDLILDMKLNTSNDANISLYTEDATDNSVIPIWHRNYEINASSVNALQESISSLNFNNGQGIAKVYFNINKNYTTPNDIVNITVVDANTSTSWMGNPGATNIFNGSVLNKQIQFRYGRLKISNAAAYSSDINTTFEYQYWTSNGWVKNTDHTNANFGDFNHTLNIAINPYVTITNSPAINNGEQRVVFHTNHGLPYSAKVHLQINSWLWYHPLAKDYQDPSITNQDCLTHPCLKLDFLKSGSAWGGVQAISNTKFSEENRTSEMNVTHTDVNVSKSQVKKINW